jgi:excisionase family DNA binding protein
MLEMDEMVDLVTIRECAAMLRLSCGTVRRLCRSGQLAHVRLGDRGTYRIVRSKLPVLAQLADLEQTRGPGEDPSLRNRSADGSSRRAEL